MRVEDLRAIVTGAASGMGRAFARHLLQEGASVVGIDRDEEGLRSLASELAEAGGRFVTRAADVTSEADVSGWPVSFVEYSWKLNIAPPSSGEWVTVTAEGGAALERDGGGGPARVGRGEILAVGRREAGRVLVDPGPGGERGWVPAGSVAPYRP